jgi:hypothetical protein
MDALAPILIRRKRNRLQHMAQPTPALIAFIRTDTAFALMTDTQHDERVAVIETIARDPR